MKTLLAALFAAGLVSAQAGDNLFTSPSLGKRVLQANDRLARTWFFEATGGPVFGVNGDLTRSLVDGPLALDAQNFDDIYNSAWLLGFRFGRHIGLYDAYFRFAYTQADGGRDQVGTFANSALTATFGDYSDFALLGGIRREFMQPSRLHPYLGFEAGVRFVDGIDLDIQSMGRVPFYDDSAVFTAEVTAGVSYDITDVFRIGVETGLRYQGGLDEIESSGGLEDFNDDDALLFVPLMLTGTLNF